MHFADELNSLKFQIVSKTHTSCLDLLMQQENKAFSDSFCRYSTIIYSMHLMFFVLQKRSLFHGVNNNET